MAKIARVLKTDVMGDLSAIAQLLQSRGRGKDKVLAHITPEEAKLLKKRGGRGSRNPDTGLLEFDDAVAAPTPPPDVAAPSLADVTVTAQPVTGPTPTDVSTPFYLSPTSGAAPAAGFSTDPMAQVMEPITGPGAAAVSPFAAPEAAPPMSSMGAYANIPVVDTSADQLQEVTPEGKMMKPAYTRSLLDRIGKQGLTALGIAGVGGLANALQARKAANQIAAAQQEQAALAKPYQEAGRAMVGAAERGELTPQSAQAYQAARAQMQQRASQMGGVGVEQMATQLEAFRQQLLQQQYTYGLQVAQIGDNVAIGAIRTGLQLDQAMNASTQNFYSSLAGIAAGVFAPRQVVVQQPTVS